jgi:hypothetical protein
MAGGEAGGDEAKREFDAMMVMKTLSKRRGATEIRGS